MPSFFPFLLAAQVVGAAGGLPDPTDPMLEPWRWRSWDELAGQDVRAIAGSDFVVYVGTTEGVWRYDGSQWRNWGPDDFGGSGVAALHVSESGRVWAGSDRGVFELVEGRWLKRVPAAEEDVPLPITALSDAAGESVWAASRWGLVRVAPEPALFTSETMATGARAAFPSLDIRTVASGVATERPAAPGLGVVLAGTTFPQVGGDVTPMAVIQVFPDGPAARGGLQAGDMILPSEDFSGRWGAGYVTSLRTGAPFRVVGPEGERDVRLSDGTPSGTYLDFQTHSLARDRAGALWVGLRWGEIVRVEIGPGGDPIESGWQSFARAEGLDPAALPAVGIDPGGVVWTSAGSGFGGLGRYEDGVWTSLRLSDFGGTDVNPSLTVDSRGDLWVAGLGMVHRWDGDRWAVFTRPAARIPSGRVLVEAVGDQLWLGGSGAGLLSVDIGSRRWATLDGLAFHGSRTVDGVAEDWFLGADGRVVVDRSGVRTEYGPSQGLMEAPVALLVADTVVWAGGRHLGSASTARFDGGRWTRQEHPELSWSVDRSGLFVSSAGALWVGAAIDLVEGSGQLGGLLELRGGEWIHHVPPSAPASAFGIAEDRSGRIWAGGPQGLGSYADGAWRRETDPWDGLGGAIDVVTSSPEGDLWIGTRFRGLYRALPNGEWERWGATSGLPSSSIISVHAAGPNDVWVVTADGVVRLDESGWAPTPFAEATAPGPGSRIRRGADGATWFTVFAPDPGARLLFNRFTPTQRPRTWRLRRDFAPPEGTLLAPPEEVSRPGFVSLAWRGEDAWRLTPPDALLFSYRLNDGAWSPFDPSTDVRFEDLPSGDHTFELRAMDLDGNIDPVPAVATFVVVGPVWTQLWFQLLIGSLLLVAGYQALRLRQRGAHLEVMNASLDQRVQEQTERLQRTNSELTREIAEREAAEDGLRQAQKMEAVGRLAAGIAHDFNNLLTVMVGTTELLLDDDERIDEELREELEEIRGAGTRAASLTQQLLAFSRRQVLRPQPLDLPLLVERMEGMLRRLVSEDVELRFGTRGEIPTVVVDPNGFEQILLNLIVNAWQAIPGSGTIQVELDSVSLSQTEATAYDPELLAGPYVRLTVRDSGTGIAPEHLGGVFEPFFTTKEEGTGLGLATVYGIAKQSEGTVAVRSEFGVGTTFTVLLPASSPLSGAVDAPSEGAAQDLPRGSERILVVEDDRAVRALTVRILSSLGYEVTAVPGSAAAEAAADGGEPVFQLLVTDVVMPGSSGVDLGTSLRERIPGLRILYVSGYSEGYRGIDAIAGSDTDWLDKPYQPRQLARKVRALLDAPRGH